MPDDLLLEKFLSRVFRAAAVYNVFWGTVVTLFPNVFFEIFGVPPINYPFVMSGLGMCIGLYGYGYWVVAQDLRRYPQLVMIGFLGKALGPIGWLWNNIYYRVFQGNNVMMGVFGWELFLSPVILVLAGMAVLRGVGGALHVPEVPENIRSV